MKSNPIFEAVFDRVDCAGESADFYSGKKYFLLPVMQSRDELSAFNLEESDARFESKRSVHTYRAFITSVPIANIIAFAQSSPDWFVRCVFM